MSEVCSDCNKVHETLFLKDVGSVWNREYEQSVGKYVKINRQHNTLRLWFQNRSLPRFPTLAEWEEVQYPLQWPWIHISKFDLPPKPEPATIRNEDLGSEDGSDDYFPEEDGSSDEESVESEYDFVDSDSDCEIDDVRREARLGWESPTPSEETRLS